MAAPERQRDDRPPAPRRRPRLVRGPVTIGEPAAVVEPRLVGAEPYRPDTIADGGSAFGLTVRAASVRGLYKRYEGGPRQDDLCLRLHEPTGTVIAVVADGVSAAPRSDMGAALAVRQAAAAALRQLDGEGIRWPEVFEHAGWALVEEHRRFAADPEAGVEDASAALATTLVMAAVTSLEEGRSARVQVAAVGDSPALVLGAEATFTPVIGAVSEDDDGLLGAGVDALPGAAREVLSAECTLEGDQVLLLCTDGLALPLAEENGEVGRALSRELARPPDIVDFARLLDFSRSTYDDDRTLVALWCAPEP